MRTVIQRVKKAVVTVDDKVTASMGTGLLLLVGIEEDDTLEDAEWLARKVSQMRIFNDEKGVMNLSVCDISGDIIVVSQFTLHARTRKGNRPSYINAASPEKAIPLYNQFIEILESLTGRSVGRGIFGAMMQVELINDGPVTLIIDTRAKE
ncbi:MAG: D-tyrosyl-tRNA(Tyr) deacylase [Bacteroidales bacterium]|nr:D-tyrosyl-tRNA(Tyr) deacylase [Bacteroidales bacterium]